MGSRMPIQTLNRTFIAADTRIAHRNKKSHSSTAGNFTMHDCYEKLKELVPTIPKNKKITRVQILQHVIDYIQDLQSALESYNIDVHNVDFRQSMDSVMSVAAQFSSAAAAQQQQQQQQQSCPNRTPFTTLPPVPQQQCENVHPQQTQSKCNLDWQRQVRKYFHHDYYQIDVNFSSFQGRVHRSLQFLLCFSIWDCLHHIIILSCLEKSTFFVPFST